MRLTKDIRKKILMQNDGFVTRTSYSGRNRRESRVYTINDGSLHIRAVGKTSWADSRYDEEWVASDKETHRFLRNNLGILNLDGIE